MERVERQPVNDDLVYEIVPYLVYTRRQEAFKFLERIIQSNESTYLSANADNEENILCGYRVLEYIAPVMINFPLPVDEFGELYQKCGGDGYQNKLGFLSKRVT